MKIKLARLLMVLSGIAVFSCNRATEPAPTPIDEPPVIEDITGIPFKISPVSNSAFFFRIHNSPYLFDSLKLELAGEELAGSSFQDIGGLSEARLDYSFEADQAYNLVLESVVTRDTVFRYRIGEYIHRYHYAFDYQKLTDFTNRTDFDLSPSRQTIFFCDYINNIFVLKKLNLTTDELTVLDDDFDNGNLIRALSDQEIMYGSKRWNDRYLQEDSLALVKFNLDTQAKELLDFGSQDYGRFSSVVNNHIMLTHPFFNGQEASSAVIDLEDGSKTIISGDYIFPRENTYDQIYLNHSIFDFDTKTFVEPLDLQADAEIMYFDEENDLGLAVNFDYGQEQVADTKIQVYRNGNFVFEDDYEQGRSILVPRIIQEEDDKIILFIQYQFDTEFLYDGYYELDLAQQTIRLIQNDGEPFFKYDFQLATDELISVRADGIYRLAKK